jgi:single-stranded-DNA-specific exonuclease
VLSARLQIPACPPEAIAALRRELGVSDVLAQALVRRGFGDPQQARALLDGGESHPSEAFDGIEGAIEPILRHIAQHRRITVHGDYDVDGVCATALLVQALRRLGAEVDWHIPDRAAGYGLREGAVRAIAQRGSGLVITVDCGITAVEEVALARRLGIEVVITDHHAPRADGLLPQAPIVHPALCGYPCPHLCGTAVAYKLAQALRSASRRDPAELHLGLDLVALASVADVVELTGENRTLLRAGLRALSNTTRPGLRALIEVAKIDPCRLDTRAVGFGLAPRINAPGRLYTAAPSLELLLTQDFSRAAQLAAALDRCNGERRHVEQRILFEAEAQLRELGGMPAYVLAGEGWHPGVVGIVASQIAERVNRPAVLVSLDGEAGRGSGRSIAGFDLLAGLRACEAHLAAYGGHRAACGLEIERRCLDDFRAAFAEHAAEALGESDLAPVEHVDAIVSVRDLGLPLAEELARLAPFGRGNPQVRLLTREATIGQVQAMGQGRHARFRVFGDGAHAGAVCFGSGAKLPVGEGEAVDATFTLEVNEWRGVSEPRLVLRSMLPATRAPHARPPDAELPPGAEGPSTREPQPLQLALAVP